MRVLIVGAGGHAQVVADIFLRRREQHSNLELVGFIDDRSSLHGQRVLGLPVLGAFCEIATIPHDGIVIAIGDNHVRSRLFSSLCEQGEVLINAIHPTAVIAPDVTIGCGVMICAGVVVNTGTSIGDNTILNTACSVDHHNRIGTHVHLAPGVHVGGNVDVAIGGFVGVSAAVLPGQKLGEWAIVGAGAVVTTNLPAWTTSVGVPARVIKWRSALDDGAAAQRAA